MKPIETWDEDYILELAASRELDYLEFKGRKEVDLTISSLSDIRRDNLAKALSALVNLGGGILILGIDDKTRMVDDGGIDQNIKKGTKAWLENILPTLVDPPLQKMNVYEVIGRKVDSNILPGRAMYLIEIKESPIAPHQSSHDHIYYGRSGAKSIPLGHRMVLDIFNRKQYPDLDIEFYWGFVDDVDPNYLKREGQHTVLDIQIENKGPIFANYVNSILYFPEYLLEPAFRRSVLGGYPVQLDDGRTYTRIIRENVLSQFSKRTNGEVSRDSGRYTPMLPGRAHSWQIPVVDNFADLAIYFARQGVKLKWKLFADNAPCKEGEMLLSEIKVIL